MDCRTGFMEEMGYEAPGVWEGFSRDGSKLVPLGWHRYASSTVHSAMNALSSVSVKVLLCYVFLCLSLSGI